MIYFIINPAAGRGKSQQVIWTIEKFMTKKWLKYKIEITKYPEHATELAKKAIIEGATKIIAVGGDGTIFETVSGMGKSDVMLGILPLGTGNDLIRTLNIRQNIDEALEVITGDNFIVSDLISVNDKYFLNIASVGIDAEIVKSAIDLKKDLKGFSYFGSVIKNILTYKPYKAVLNIDGEIIDDTFTLVAIANGKYYGGGFKIAPKASMKDGNITICVVRKLINIKMLYLFPLVILGKHGIDKNVSFYKAKKVEIYLNDYCNLNIDGNIYESKKYLKFEIHEKALKILVLHIS